MDCRTDELCDFKLSVGFKLYNVVNRTQQTITRWIKNLLVGKNMQSEQSVLGYRIDGFFPEYCLTIKVDKSSHEDRDISYEIERQKALGKELGCVFVSINPDEKDFNIFKATSKTNRHIEKLTKKSLIDKISKRLLELEIKWNHCIKSKCLKNIVQKWCNQYKTCKTIV